jgi:hypothetical protein
MAVDLKAVRTSAPTRPGSAQDIVAAVLGAVVVVAIHLDGRAHLLNLPDSFFTPWHGLIYGGVTALSAWLLVMGRRNWARHGRLLHMPAGYGLALAGVEHGSELTRVYADPVAQHGLQQSFLPLRTDLVAYRGSLVTLTHAS